MAKSGVIILYKESGITSQSAVNRVKRLLSTDKAGHTGTLDPLASGVLPILIGRGVKASEFLTSENKHYRATLLLGLTTDTEDITGTPLSESEKIPSEAQVLEAAASMQGDSLQIPPMYSAIKVGGKKLYELARKGESIEREPRPITIYSIKAEKTNEREYALEVVCSKGTYIRTLCADIGKSLGCGGCMKTLERLSAGGYGIDEAHTLAEIEAMTESERLSLVRPTEEIFKELRAVTLPPFFARLARCGVEIYLKKAGISASEGERLTLYDEKGFFALGEVRKFDTGLAVKPIRQFDI